MDANNIKNVFDQRSVPSNANILDVIESYIGGVNTIAELIINSPMADNKVVVSAGKMAKNMKSVVHLLVDTFVEISAELTSLALHDTFSRIVSDPIGLIKRIKSGEASKDKNGGVLDYYFNLITVMSNMSEAAKNINYKNVKKGIGQTLKILRLLVLFGKFQKMTAVIADTAIVGMKAIMPIWNNLYQMMDAMRKFTEASEGVDYGDARKQIKRLIRSFIWIILDSQDLAELLIHGEVTSKRFVFFKRKNKVNLVDIYAGLAALVVLMPLFRITFENAAPVAEALNRMGGSTKRMRSGVDNFYSLMLGWRKRGKFHKGLLPMLSTIGNKFSKGNNLQMGVIRALFVISEASLILAIAQPMIESLIRLSSNRRKIQRGIMTFEYILGGQDKKFFKKKWHKDGIIDVINNLELTDEVLKKGAKLLLFVAGLSLMFSIFSVTASQLALIGKNRRKMKRGIKAFAYTLYKMIDIINDDRIRSLEVKTMMSSMAKMMIMFIGYAALAVPMTVIAVAAPSAIAAMFTTAIMLPMIAVMLLGLRMVRGPKKTQLILEGSNNLKLLSAAYIQFAQLIQLMKFGKNRKEWMIVGASIAALIPTIIIMLIGLRLVKGNKVTLMIAEGSKNLTMMAAAYAAFAASLMSLAKVDWRTVVASALTVIAAAFTSARAFGKLGDRKVSSNAVKGMATAVSVAASLTLLAGTFAAVDLLTGDIDFETIVRFIGMSILSITAFVLIGAAIGVVGAYLAAGLTVTFGICALMIFLSYTLIIIANNMKKIENLNLDIKLIKKSSMGIFESIAAIAQASVALNVGDLAAATVKIHFMLRIAKQVNKMAKILSKLSQLKIAEDYDSKGNPTKYFNMKAEDFKNAAMNASSILRFFVYLFDDSKDTHTIEVFGDTVDISPIKGSQLEKISARTKRKVRQLQRIVVQIGKMANTLQKISQLKIAEAYDAKGNPTKFYNMKAENFANAALNAGGILMFFVNLFDDSQDSHTLDILGTTITMVPIKGTQLDKISTRTKRKVRQLQRIVVQIGKMAATLHDISQLRIAEEYDGKGNPTKFHNMKAEDFRDAALNAAGILTFFVNLFDDSAKSHKLNILGATITMNPITGSQLENIDNTSKRKVRQLQKIVGYVGKMAETLHNVAQLRLATEYNDEGVAINYRNMTSDDFKDAALNTAGIMQFFAAMFGDKKTTIEVWNNKIPINPISEKSLDQFTGKTKRKMKKIGKIVGYVGDMADVISKVAQLVIPDIENHPDDLMTEDGRIKYWRPVKSSDWTNLSSSVTKIMTAVIDAIVVNAGKIENIKKKNIKKIEKAMQTVEPVAQCADVIANLAAMLVPEMKDGAPVYIEHRDTDGNLTLVQKMRPMKDEEWTAAENRVGEIMTFMINTVVANADKVNDIKKRNLDKINMALSSIQPVSDMANVLISLANGSIPTEYDSNGNPTKYKDFGSIIGDLRYKTIDHDHPNWNMTGMWAIKYMMKDMMTVGLNAIASVSEKSIKDAKSKAADMSSLLEGMGKYFDNIYKIKPESVESFGKSVEHTKSLVNAINSADLQKIKYASSLVENMAKITNKMQGDVGKLADTINKKLVDALKELKKVLEDVNKTMENKTSSSAAAKSSISSESSGKGNNPPKSTSPKLNNPFAKENAKVNANAINDLVNEIQNLVDAMSDSGGIYVRPASNTVWPEK